MRVVENFKDYQILDTSDGEKLESWAGVILIRPDPQIIWKTPKTNENWSKASGHYIRSTNGGGEWEFSKKIPESWNISYKDLKFVVRPTGFKHLGLFPEQAVNWDYFMDIIPKQNRPIKVLNLFAYTGGASIA
ncbi:MAG: SAM-dependent methyltransferase, partial [Oscillospiraceae bacterium]